MKLYTMGYSLMKGSHAERKAAFQDRVKETFPEGVVLIDIRREDSGSRNGKSFNQGHGMMWLVAGLDFNEHHKTDFRFGYIIFPELANTHGNSQKGLNQYIEDLATDGRKVDGIRKLQKNIHYFQSLREKPYMTFCLLCGCRDAYKKSGAINCHRVILAEELIKELGKGWEVEHLG